MLVVLVVLVALVAWGPPAPPAAVARTRPPVYLGVPYATVDPLQVTDIYPAASPGAPLVVLVHGDGWQSDATSTKHMAGRARQLQAAGFTTFAINYRSDSPTVPAFPMEVDDVVAATTWAIGVAATYNADPSRVVLIGGSAGSTLVGLAAGQLNGTVPGTVDAVVTLSGAQDFLLFRDLNAPRVGGAQRNRAQALGCSPATPCTPAWEAQWSPARQVDGATCPGSWLAFNSTHETTPLTQAQALVGALVDAGCDATLVARTGTSHGFGYWHAEWPTIEEFIRGDAEDPLSRDAILGSLLLNGRLVLSGSGVGR
jgi:acetyl esterase/lipase